MEKETNIYCPAKVIQAKISWLAAQFKIALDKRRNTRHGIKSDEGEISYHDFMISWFKRFFELEPVLIDCPSIDPYGTTDEIDGDNHLHCRRRDDDDDEDNQTSDKEGNNNNNNNKIDGTMQTMMMLS